MAEITLTPAPPGSIDWDTLRSTPYTFTLQEFSNYSAAGLDPYIVLLARNICSPFPLSAEGQNRVLEDLLIDYDAAGKTGAIFLGLCGVLNEYFTEQSVLDVFAELASYTRLPEDLAPTPASWNKLIQVSRDVLSTTRFGVLVDTYTKLGEVDPRPELVHTSAGGVAECLRPMADLHRGLEKNGPISIMGGKDAGWFAAVAEWLFDLNIVVLARWDGDVLYSNCDKDNLQLRIIFSNAGVPVDRPPIEQTPLLVRERGESSG